MSPAGADARVAVLGLGIETQAWIAALGPDRARRLVVVESRSAVVDEVARPLGLVDVRAELPDDLAVDAIVRSPGFSPYDERVAAYRRAGIPTTTPLGLWLAARGDRPTVAITGTKGKSSAATVTGAALEALGASALVLGNIGVAAWTLAPEQREVAVVEVSSYQACDLPFTAPVAALSALGLDHLDWHGGEATYLADKARVFTAPTASGERWCGVLDDVVLPPAFASVPFTRIASPGPSIRARNVRLGLATAAAALEVEVVDAAEHEAALLADYPRLPGRFALVGSIDGVEVIDDALASNPFGAASSLRELPGDGPVALVVGGRSRGVDGTDLAAAVAARPGATTVIGIDDASAWASDLAEQGIELRLADTLEVALDVARVAVGTEGTILFSPGMPTPPDQGDWRDRSARVAAWVAAQT